MNNLLRVKGYFYYCACLVLLGWIFWLFFFCYINFFCIINRLKWFPVNSHTWTVYVKYFNIYGHLDDVTSVQREKATHFIRINYILCKFFASGIYIKDAHKVLKCFYLLISVEFGGKQTWGTIFHWHSVVKNTIAVVITLLTRWWWSFSWSCSLSKRCGRNIHKHIRQ